MPAEHDDQAPPERDDQAPQYTRYRAGPRLLPGRDQDTIGQPRSAAELAAKWRARITVKRVVLGVLALVFAWLRARTGTVVSAAICHFVFNLFLLALESAVF